MRQIIGIISSNWENNKITFDYPDFLDILICQILLNWRYKVMAENDLTEKETLASVVKFLTHLLEYGTFDEIREVNIHVSSRLLKVDKIVRKHWPKIIEEELNLDNH